MENVEEFDLDAFIAKVNTDKVVKRDDDRVKKLRMNGKYYRGTLTFIPLYSRAAGGFYQKLSPVYEFFGDSTVFTNYDEGVWYKILQKDLYGELTEAESDLYDEVLGLLKTLKDKYGLDDDELRRKHYTLFFGICQKIKPVETDPEGKIKPSEAIGKPCIFIYNSPYLVNAYGTALQTKIDNNGSKAWITKVFTKSNTGRRGVMQIGYTLKEVGVGYDINISFPMNNAEEGITMVDPDMVIPDEVMEKFDNVIPDYLGWQYDDENKKLFHTTVFKELRDQLRLRLKEEQMNGSEVEEAKVVEEVENKNNLTPKVEATDEATTQTRRIPF